MTGESTARMRLCPQCANSIAEDATDCRYCKADFSSQFAPEWLKRGERSHEARTSSDNHKRFSIPGNVIWLGAVLGVALAAFFAGGALQRNQQSLSAQANLKQLQAKEQVIQTQEAQLAQTRQQLNENSQQLAEMKSKLEASQKELSLTQQRLSAAARQADRLNASRSPVAARTVSRVPDAASPAAPAAARRTAGAGVYVTTRGTSVYENPSSTSRVMSQIERGTRINVAGAGGGWLEVRSKHGNPPGYVRADDARVLGATN
jgi:Tfp pilus assembly protein FimV